MLPAGFCLSLFIFGHCHWLSIHPFHYFCFLKRQGCPMATQNTKRATYAKHLLPPQIKASDSLPNTAATSLIHKDTKGEKLISHKLKNYDLGRTSAGPLVSQVYRNTTAKFPPQHTHTFYCYRKRDLRRASYCWPAHITSGCIMEQV